MSSISSSLMSYLPKTIDCVNVLENKGSLNILKDVPSERSYSIAKIEILAKGVLKYIYKENGEQKVSGVRLSLPYEKTFPRDYFLLSFQSEEVIKFKLKEKMQIELNQVPEPNLATLNLTTRLIYTLLVTHDEGRIKNGTRELLNLCHGEEGMRQMMEQVLKENPWTLKLALRNESSNPFSKYLCETFIANTAQLISLEKDRIARIKSLLIECFGDVQRLAEKTSTKYLKEVEGKADLVCHETLETLQCVITLENNQDIQTITLDY